MKSFSNNNNQIIFKLTIQKNKNFILSVYKNLQYQNLTFNFLFKKQNEFMKQSLKMIILRFETIILTNEKINEVNYYT